MKLNSFYPVIMTDIVEETGAFYQKYFGFETVFDAGWYISMKHGFGCELAVLESSHQTVPESFGKNAEGIVLNFEVDDADEVYHRFVMDEQLPLIMDIRNEEFGQRHFMTEDPNGVLIDVIEMIPPDASFEKHYKKEVWTD